MYMHEKVYEMTVPCSIVSLCSIIHKIKLSLYSKEKEYSKVFRHMAIAKLAKICYAKIVCKVIVNQLLNNEELFDRN